MACCFAWPLGCYDGGLCNLLVDAPQCGDSRDPALGDTACTTPDTEPWLATAPIPTDAGRYPYNHAASIAELPNGDLLVVWGAGSRELADDAVILGSRRPAGGDAWSSPAVITDAPGFADANPVLFVDDSDTVWLLHVEMFGPSFCLGRVAVRTSTDCGQTWSGPRYPLQTICVMVRNKLIITSSGRWILPAYVQSPYQSQFWVSDDRGATWQPGVPLLTLPNNLQPAIVELGDGSLLALMRTAGNGGFTWQARSPDGGASWQFCQRTGLPNPDSGLDMLRLRSGELVVAYNDSATERTPLVVVVSADQGATWSPPRVIEAGQPQLSYPSLTQSDDGTIHLAYSHRLTHIQYAAFNRTWLCHPPDER